MPHDRTTTSRRTRLAALGLATVGITLVGAVAYAADDPGTTPQAAASGPDRAYAWPSSWPTAWPGNWPRPTRTPRPTATPTATPSTSTSTSASATPTAEPTASASSTPTADPTTSASSTPTVEPTPTVTATATPTVEPTATATATPTATASATATPTPTPTPTPTSSATVAPTATADPDGYTDRPDWAASVLTELNAERAANGLPALSLNTKLSAAAAGHNQSMAEVNILSHQLDGEPGLGARVSAAGYSWSSCGENIAWNGNRSEAGVLAVQRSMYNETPPNDGHRRNILSTSFTEVGISVIDDSVHRKVWLVTDFGRPR